MLLHHNPLFRIYFGDARDKIFPSVSLEEKSALLKKQMEIQALVFLHQVHGTQGEYIFDQEHAADLQSLSADGDYLITSTPHIGIGILTADCLPIICYDTFNQAVAIIHAGWRGSVQGIALVTLNKMQQEIGTKLENVRVFFGPCAKVCCYQVTPDFLAHLEPFAFADQVIKHQNSSLFFDVPLFNRLLLEDYGIARNAFQLQYNYCTIEDSSFYSYRRQGSQAGRQMTVACLT